MSYKAQPVISIITPSYNQAEFIEKNIKSVMKYDDSAVEHIIVDGGSTDGTVDILNSYENEYNLRWLSEPDNGQSHAINKGIEMASGKWIGWQNADDYYLPGGLDALHSAVTNHNDIDYVYGDLRFVNRDGKTIRHRYHTRPSKFIQKHWQLVLANHTLLINNEVLRNVGGINEEYEYVMDAELFWRLLCADLRAKHIPQLVAAHRMHKEAKMSNRDEKRYENELSSLYCYSAVEKRIPERLTKLLAVGLKTVYLIMDRRPYPIYDLYADFVHTHIYPFRSWDPEIF